MLFSTCIPQNCMNNFKQQIIKEQFVNKCHFQLSFYMFISMAISFTIYYPSIIDLIHLLSNHALVTMNDFHPCMTNVCIMDSRTNYLERIFQTINIR